MHGSLCVLLMLSYFGNFTRQLPGLSCLSLPLSTLFHFLLPHLAMFCAALKTALHLLWTHLPLSQLTTQRLTYHPPGPVCDPCLQSILASMQH
ncbi:hypothetical protein BDQ17DRAFT_237299 [Cyathus striatus]|nr:hypothetical protein BDQ17DRAFT_237299 [Cyathus striatus]